MNKATYIFLGSLISDNQIHQPQSHSLKTITPISEQTRTSNDQLSFNWFKCNPFFLYDKQLNYNFNSSLFNCSLQINEILNNSNLKEWFFVCGSSYLHIILQLIGKRYDRILQRNQLNGRTVLTENQQGIKCHKPYNPWADSFP